MVLLDVTGCLSPGLAKVCRIILQGVFRPDAWLMILIAVNRYQGRQSQWPVFFFEYTGLLRLAHDPKTQNGLKWQV